MTYELANKIVTNALEKAKELNIAVSIAVVDNNGILMAFAKMDGSISISPRFAFAKAYTSGTIGLPTSGMAGYAEEGKPYYGLTSIFGGELTTIAGGLPIMEDGKLIGGIGVGGSTDVTQDEEIAKSAVSV
jgi:uncharacterized protein GlcG (DUF336 family)